MADMAVKEKAAGEAAKQNGTTEILNDSDPFDNPVSAVLADEGNGVKSFIKANGDKFLTGPLGVVFIPAGKSEDNAQKVCGPLEVIGRYRDKKGNGWGRVVVWHDGDNTRHELKISEGKLSTRQSEVFEDLVNGGLEIFTTPSSGRPNRVVDFIRSYPREALPKLCSTKSFGWHDIGHAFVLPDRIIGETISGEGVLFDGDESGAPKYTSKGTLKDWQDTVGKIAMYSYRISFCICAALASPLLNIVGMESGGFHFVGESSKGKTSAQRAAVSLFASAKKGGELKSWRSTDNGVEGLAAGHNDLPLIFEEMNQANPKNLKEIIYMLANESGKNRMSKGTQVKATASWRLIFISSGEKTATEYMREANLKNEDGGEIRLANIPLDDGEMGIFDSLPDGVDAKTLAEKLQTITETKYYGTAGPEFIARLVDDIKQNGINAFTENLEQGLTEFQKTVNSDPDPMVGRVARRFALVAVAGELAIQYGVLPWARKTAWEAAQVCFQVWRKGFRSKEDQAADLIRCVLEFHQSNRERFDEVTVLSTGDDIRRSSKDKLLGVIVLTNEHTEVVYFQGSFKSEVLAKNGFPERESLKILKDSGILAANDRLYFFKIAKGKTYHGVPEGRYIRLVPENWVENEPD